MNESQKVSDLCSYSLDDTETKEFHFDFGVYSISEAEANALLYKIVGLVEEMGAVMGGGYREYENSTDPA